MGLRDPWLISLLGWIRFGRSVAWYDVKVPSPIRPLRITNGSTSAWCIVQASIFLLQLTSYHRKIRMVTGRNIKHGTRSVDSA